MVDYQVVELNQGRNHSSFFQLNDVISWYQETGVKERTLRELKRQFPSWQTISADLETWITKELLERHDGRYRLIIPFVTEGDFLELSSRLLATSQLILSQAHKELPCLAASPWLLPLAVSQLQTHASDLVIATTLKEKDSRRVASLITDKHIFLEVGTSADLGLANYFTAPVVTPTAEATRCLIGDVDPVYFTQMAGNVLEGIIAQERLPKGATNIFLTTLLNFKYVTLVDGKPLLTCQAHQLPRVDFEGSLQEVLIFLETSLSHIYSKSIEQSICHTIVLKQLFKKTQNDLFFISLN